MYFSSVTLFFVISFLNYAPNIPSSLPLLFSPFFLVSNRGYASCCRTNVFSRVRLIIDLELLPPCGDRAREVSDAIPLALQMTKAFWTCERADVMDSDDSQLTWSQRTCPFLPLIETLKSKLEQSSNRRKLPRTSQLPYCEEREFNLPRKKQAKWWFEHCN